MAGIIRKPYQGVWNIIRFNWPFYMWAAIVIAGLLTSKYFIDAGNIIDWVVLLTVLAIFVSLVVSYYVYDLSGLYTFSWLDVDADSKNILNVHAGYDETSYILQQKFPNAKLLVADFYDPQFHTEASIRRARKAYPPYPGTLTVSTSHLPMKNDSASFIFATLAAHEIRNKQERIKFFKELRRVINSSGQIIVTEHLRDTANFLAYNLGFFHFHSRASWRRTFRLADLKIVGQKKITPFITIFILEKNGTAS